MHSPAEQADTSYPTLAELVPAHWASGTVQMADGTSIHYTRTGGPRPALLLLHGVQGAGLMWLRVAQALADEYDVVMPDFRGHGASSRIAGPISADTLMVDTVALIKALGLEQLAVAGHSMGADIAGRLAAVYPLRALVLVDPALLNFSAAMAMDPDNPPPWMAAIFETMRGLSSQPHAERMASARQLLPPGTPPWAAPDYVGFVEAMAQFDLAFYRSIQNMGYLFEEPGLLAQIGCPTLLLTARPMRPDLDTSAGLAALKDNLKTCRHEHFPDSGHAIMFDQHERFVATLRAFLQGLPSLHRSAS